MSDLPVLVDIKGKVLQITLNRPDNRNMMNHEVLPAFREAITQARDNKSLRCLIITGSGNSFCSGADFRSDIHGDEPCLPHESILNFYQPFLSILKIEVPVIAAMNGHAIGGGLGLALVSDIRIANKNSKYGANFVRLGLHSGMAISYMLPRIVGLPIANELLYTGRLFNGDKALEIGLANYSLEGVEVIEKAWELAREIEANAPVAVKMIKRSIYRGFDWNPINAAEMEAHCQSRTSEMEDAKEGIAALLEKRKPEFQGR